jgi:hypothetical protein
VSAEHRDERADEAERELEDMERRSRRVGEHIEEAREDWAAKQADGTVPGAVPAEDEDEDEVEDGGGGELPSGSG